MKRIFFLFCMVFGSVYADTTANLITSGTNHTWSGVTTGTLPGNYMPGGPTPIYDPSTNTITYSYNNSYVGQVIWINQVLSGTGIQVNGYNYSYDVRNMNGDDRQGNVDSFTVSTALRGPSNSVLLSHNQYFNTKFEWTSYSGTKTAVNPYNLADLTYLQIGIQGADSGFWAGYFGPQIRNVNMSLNYTAAPYDPCTNDPLYSTSCPGYQQAYHDQQCSINSLYATTCPGYQQAYYTQQCSINPLYDSGCPGYQQAYFNQQCSNDPLYNNQCPGYAQAYFDQQCSLNGLYDRSCPNYAQAYATQQLLNQQNSLSQTASVTITPTSEPLVEVKEDGKVSTDVPLVADPVVNSVLTKNTEAKKEDKKEEKKEEPKAEKPKENAARQAAIAAATNPDPATQTQSEKEFEQTVASQNAAVNAIAFVPGFSAYQNAIIPDTNALIMQRQYNKPVTDNARAMRQLNGASDRLHDEMIQQQYR